MSPLPVSFVAYGGLLRFGQQCLAPNALPRYRGILAQAFPRRQGTLRSNALDTGKSPGPDEPTRGEGIWHTNQACFPRQHPKSGLRRLVLITRTALWFSRSPQRKQEHLAGRPKRQALGSFICR